MLDLEKLKEAINRISVPPEYTRFQRAMLAIMQFSSIVVFTAVSPFLALGVGAVNGFKDAWEFFLDHAA